MKNWKVSAAAFIEKVKSKIKETPREKLIMVAGVFAAVVLTLWITSHDASKNDDGNTEMGLLIPKGYLVVPLELANAQALSALVTRSAVVDVFEPGNSKAAVENLRVIKLDAGEGPLFGALVPDKLAGRLQETFSRPKLRAALRTLKAGETVFHLNNNVKPLLIEVPTGD